MRTRLLVLALLLLAFARPGAASSLHLAWDRCLAGGGADDITFPCDRPGHPVVLYGSLDLTRPVEDLIAIDFRIDFYVDASTIPPFWNFQTEHTTRGCNPGLAVRTDPLGNCPGHIVPFPDGNTMLSYAIFPGPLIPGPQSPGQPAEARIVGNVYGDLAPGLDLAPGVPYFAFALEFYADAAIEAGGSCAGCSTPVNLLQPNQESAFVRTRVVLIDTGGTETVYPDHRCVTINRGFGVCAPTPTRRETWGLLKSLYR